MTRFNTFATRVALAAAALAVAGPAAAQPATTATGQQPGTTAAGQQPATMAAGQRGAMAAFGAARAGAPSAADRQFMIEAAKGGMLEVALGQLASQKGTTDAVKQFGARMVEDHGKANDELKALAASKNVALPAAPPVEPKARKMERLGGAAFDRAYMADMLADHKKDVALFEREVRNGRDADVKAFAAKTLPTLKAHLAMVQTGRHGGTAGGAAMKH